MREHKGPKIDSAPKNGKKRQPEQGSADISTTTAYTMSKTTLGATTAYTLSTKDALNFRSQMAMHRHVKHTRKLT